MTVHSVPTIFILHPEKKMSFRKIMERFGAHFASYLPLKTAPRINCREYGFPDNAAVVPFYIPYYVAAESNLAAFAASPDYHALSAAAFRECAELADAEGCFFRGFADVSPFAEVRLAAMCGLGIIGDHGMIITPEHSSFVVLGEIVTDSAGVTSDFSPANGEIHECDHCGECRRACPTDALDERSRCISAITQKKGELSDEERRVIRETRSPWGCDRCALACPHTRRAAEAGTLETDVEYFRRNRLGNVSAADIAAMTDEEYASYTFSWRKREVLIRNLLICDENSAPDNA